MHWVCIAYKIKRQGNKGAISWKITRDRAESATWGRPLHVYWPKPVKLTSDIPNPMVEVLDDLIMKKIELWN